MQRFARSLLLRIRHSMQLFLTSKSCEQTFASTVLNILFPCTVAYSSDHLDFKWKLTDPVNIFSAEMAEFDLTNTELIAKYVSYVSGK